MAQYYAEYDMSAEGSWKKVVCFLKLMLGSWEHWSGALPRHVQIVSEMMNSYAACEVRAPLYARERLEEMPYPFDRESISQSLWPSEVYRVLEAAWRHIWRVIDGLPVPARAQYYAEYDMSAEGSWKKVVCS